MKPEKGKMKPPFWATREFRWLIGILILGVATLLVLTFEINPLLRQAQKGAAPDRAPGAELLPRQEARGWPQDPALLEALKAVKDATPIADQDAAYRGLLAQLEGLEPGALSSAAVEVPYPILARSSKELRGKPIKVTALLLDWKELALETKVAEVEFIHRAYLMEPGGNEGYVVDLLDSPEKIERRSLVATEGLFLKVGIYEAKKGFVEAPLLLGRSLRPVVRARAPNVFDIEALAVGTAAMALILLLLTLWLRRQGVRKRRLPFKGLPPQPGGGAREPWEGFVERDWKARLGSALKERTGKWPRLRRQRGPSAAPTPPRQVRKVLLLLVAATAALGGWTAYRIFKLSRPVAIDFNTACDEAMALAEAARHSIEGLEDRVGAGDQPLEPAERDAAQGALATLEKSAERLQALLESARRSGGEDAARAIEARAAQLLRLKLWVLDGSDFLDSAREPGRPRGFYAPFRALVAAVEEASSALGGLEAAGRDGLPAVSQALDRAAEACRQLEDYLKQGLARDDLAGLQLPEARELGETAARIREEKARAERLAAKP